MCKLMEDMRNEAAHEAKREGARNTAKRFLKMGKLSREEIADGTGLPLEEVKALEEVIKSIIHPEIGEGQVLQKKKIIGSF